MRFLGGWMPGASRPAPDAQEPANGPANPLPNRTSRSSTSSTGAPQGTRRGGGTSQGLPSVPLESRSPQGSRTETGRPRSGSLSSVRSESSNSSQVVPVALPPDPEVLGAQTQASRDRDAIPVHTDRCAQENAVAERQSVAIQTLETRQAHLQHELSQRMPSAASALVAARETLQAREAEAQPFRVAFEQVTERRNQARDALDRARHALNDAALPASAPALSAGATGQARPTAPARPLPAELQRLRQAFRQAEAHFITVQSEHDQQTLSLGKVEYQVTLARASLERAEHASSNARTAEAEWNARFEALQQAIGQARTSVDAHLDAAHEVSHRMDVALAARRALLPLNAQVIETAQASQKADAAWSQLDGQVTVQATAHAALLAKVGSLETDLQGHQHKLSQLSELKERQASAAAAGSPSKHPPSSESVGGAASAPATSPTSATGSPHAPVSDADIHAAQERVNDTARQLAETKTEAATEGQALASLRAKLADASTARQAAADALSAAKARRQTQEAAVNTAQEAANEAIRVRDERAPEAQRGLATIDRLIQDFGHRLNAPQDPVAATVAQGAPSGQAVESAQPQPPANGLANGPGGLPARTLWQRAVDSARRGKESVVDRTGPVKWDASLLTLAGATAGKQPTTFRDGVAPANPVTTADGAKQLGAVDKKVETAAAKASRLLLDGQAGKDATATALPAFGTAVKFAEEVTQLFKPVVDSPEAAAATSRLALGLLQHPASNAASRPDGHPLRHEEALLIATVLRAITDDPRQAARVYNRLWQSAPSDLSDLRPVGPRPPSPLDDGSTVPAGEDHQISRMTHAAQRALASTASGMQALLQLQGLRVDGDSPAPPERVKHAVEHYKLALRAADALLSLKPLDDGHAKQLSLEDIAEAAMRHSDRDQPIDDPAWLGTGRCARVRNGPPVEEDPTTLAYQALRYATANLAPRAPGEAERLKAMKPAYVALRNGFTQSGQGSEFHQMAKRLESFLTYIDLACQFKTHGPGVKDLFTQPKEVLSYTASRKVGMNKTPLKTLLQAGPLGAELGTVPGEHAKRLDAALNHSTERLRTDLTAKYETLSDRDRTRAVMRLAALELWHEQVPSGFDPHINLNQGIQLNQADVLKRANDLNAQVAAVRQRMLGPASNGPAQPDARAAKPLHAATQATELQSVTRKPLTPKNLNGWFGRGKLADSKVRHKTDAMAALKHEIKVLRGKTKIDSAFEAEQQRFDAGDPQQRRNALRNVMLSVVASGDMTDYSDGRKFGVGGTFGALAANVEGIGGLTTGLTPVADINVDYAHSAVFKAGVASNTGVIFLGDESKVSGMLGVGMRAGAQLGPVGATGQLMARLGGAHLWSSGLMIRTNKQGTEHSDLPGAMPDAHFQSANWKRMGEAVVHTIFDIADKPKSERPADGGKMWADVVERLGDYRDLSFGWNTGQANQVNASLSLDGFAGVKLGEGFGASASAGLAAKKTLVNQSEAKDSAGAYQTVQAGSGSRTSVGASASLAVTHPTLQDPDRPDIGIFSRHKVGVETDLVIQAKNGFVRITTEDGKVKPNISYKHREFAVQDDFVALVNSQKGEWAARLGSYHPDGRLADDGTAMLQAFLQQVVDLPAGGNRLFIERKCLTPEAADTINACLERLAVLKRLGTGDASDHAATPDDHTRSQIGQLERTIADHVSDEASWQPFRLFVNETNQRSKEGGWTTGEVRATPNQIDDEKKGPTGMAERLVASGKLSFGTHLAVAHGGRDLITLDAMPRLKAAPPPVPAAEGAPAALPATPTVTTPTGIATPTATPLTSPTHAP